VKSPRKTCLILFFPGFVLVSEVNFSCLPKPF
jgi:hypothetical protein